MSNELLEFVFSLPEEYLLSNTGETKTILRHAMKGIVPAKVLDRHDKVGFSTPLTLNSSTYGIGNSKIAQANCLNMSNFERMSASETWRVTNFRAWLQDFVQ